MRILHIVPTYFPAVRYGGPIWSVHGLAAGQVALGHQVEVFTTNVDGPGVSDVPLVTPVSIDGVSVHYFPVTQPRRLYRSPAMRVALATRIGNFDVVHLHSVFLWPTLAAARAARKAGVPFVLSPRGMLVRDLIRAKSTLLKRSWLALFDRRTIRDAAAIHVTAAQEARDFAELGLTARRIIELPNGVDTDTIDPGEPATDVAEAIAHGPYLLSLGRMSWKKNIPALIEAMAEVPGLRLTVAGNDEDGIAGALADSAAEHGLGDRFSLIARSMGAADKAALYGNAAMFALPSLNENFGNTVLEAMAHGRPIVVSSGAGVAEVVRRADCGLVVDPRPEALAGAIGEMLRDPEAAQVMGARGAAAVRADYGWNAIAARMIEAYSELGRA